MFCSVTQVGAWPTHLTITLVSSLSTRDVQYIVTSCTAVTRNVQYITTWCMVHRHMMYKWLPSGTPPLHLVLYVTCNKGRAHGIFYGSEGAQMGTPPVFSHCVVISDHLLLLFVWFVNWIDVSSPNPKSFVAFSLSSLLIAIMRKRVIFVKLFKYCLAYGSSIVLKNHLKFIQNHPPDPETPTEKIFCRN